MLVPVSQSLVGLGGGGGYCGSQFRAIYRSNSLNMITESDDNPEHVKRTEMGTGHT